MGCCNNKLSKAYKSKHTPKYPLVSQPNDTFDDFKPALKETTIIKINGDRQNETDPLIENEPVLS